MTVDAKPAEETRLRCSSCGGTVRKKRAWLNANSVLACPACGKPIRIERFRAQAMAADLFHELTGNTSDGKGS